MFAILFAIKKSHHYFVGRHFKIRIDHQPLQFLLDQKVSTPSQYTWLAKLIASDYEIQYKHGKLNVVADSLSRLSSFEVTLQALFSVSTNLLERIHVTWENDQKL